VTTVAYPLATSPEVEAERRRALRALLRHPLLTASGEQAEEYNLVRRHSEWLKQWLMRFPVWTLHVDKEVARLRKIPPDLLDDTRPAIDRTSGTSFSKRRYALFCLALAALEQSDRQTTLGQIARIIMELVAADRDLQAAGLVFDIGNYDHRRDLVHAVRFLMDSGLLSRLDGDEHEFLNRNDASDVLYDINRSILASILNVSRSPSAIETAPNRTAEDTLAERWARLIDESTVARAVADRAYSDDDTRNQRIRCRLVRALLDDPVLYFHDLNDEERRYLAEHRGYLLRQISEATGLIAEVRREGIAMVDDEGNLTDLKLPEEGTDGHLSLLLVQWLSESSRNSEGAAIPISAIEERVRHLIKVHGSRWRKEAREAGAEIRLTEDALLRLRGLRLIQLTAGGVVPLAATGRYALRDSASITDIGSDNEE